MGGSMAHGKEVSRAIVTASSDPLVDQFVDDLLTSGTSVSWSDTDLQNFQRRHPDVGGEIDAAVVLNFAKRLGIEVGLIDGTA